jgi:hypothetical protein
MFRKRDARDASFVRHRSNVECRWFHAQRGVSSDRWRLRPRINGNTMTSKEYEKLPAADQERFMLCPDCREMFDLRSDDDVIFHLAHHKPQQPAPHIRNPERFQQS